MSFIYVKSLNFKKTVTNIIKKCDVINMESYKAKNLPFEYAIDKDMLILVAKANAKYGEYKSLLETLEFDSSYFLESVL